MNDFICADLYDLHPEAASCQTQFQLFGQRSGLAAKSAPCAARKTTCLLRQMLSQKSDGEVLVVDAAASFAYTVLGDNIAKMAMENGWTGVIILGCIRGSVAINRMDFGVKALGTNPKKSAKNGGGETDVAVQFGGVAVCAIAVCV